MSVKKLSEKTLNSLSYTNSFWENLEVSDLLTYILGNKTNVVIEKIGDNISGLRSLTREDLEDLKLNDADSKRLLACIELAKRMSTVKYNIGDLIDSPVAAAAAFQDIAWADKEHFAILCMDITNKLICKPIIISIGTATSTLASPREIFKEALKRGALRIAIAHNHPSGNLNPSDADIQLTVAVLQAGQLMDIKVLDHIILGGNDFISVREQRIDLWGKYPQND